MNRHPAQNLQEYAVVFGLVIVIAIPLIGAIGSNVVGMLGGMVGSNSSAPTLIAGTAPVPSGASAPAATPAPSSQNNGTLDGILVIDGQSLVYSKNQLTGEIQLSVQLPNGAPNNVASSDGTVNRLFVSKIDNFLAQNEEALNLPENADLKNTLLNLKNQGLYLGSRQLSFPQNTAQMGSSSFITQYISAQTGFQTQFRTLTDPASNYVARLQQIDPTFFGTVHEAGILIENISYFNFCQKVPSCNTHTVAEDHLITVSSDAGARETMQESERIGDVAEQVPTGAG